MKIHFLTCCIAFAIASHAQVQPNSQYFNVSRYLYPDSKGNLREYRAAGFAQPSLSNIPAKLFIMPSLFLREKSIKFASSKGDDYDYKTYPERLPHSISVRVSVDLSLPNDVQKPAIGAVLSGTAAHAFYPPWTTLPNGMPAMHPAAAMDIQLKQAIEHSLSIYKVESDKLKKYAAKYETYTPHIATINELRLALIVDGSEIAARSFPGSIVLNGGTLPAITLVEPTEYIKNRIANGNFEIFVAYRFLDLKISSIEARFDAAIALSNFLDETQRAITSRKSSGWQVFGIGSRRSKMKTSLEKSMKSESVMDEMQGTRIVTYDATDDMIRRFESSFFPELSKDVTISRHLDAANKAQDDGKDDLAKIHRDYAAALQSNDEIKEVDTLAAAASLAAGDYVGFVAHGVRMSDQSHAMTNTYRGIAEVNVRTKLIKEWNEVHNVSVMRETNITITPEEKQRYEPYMGLISGSSYVYPFIRQNTWGNPEVVMRKGLAVTGIAPGSPLAQAGILPGSVITAIGNDSPTTEAELRNIIDDFNPGDTVSIKVLIASGNMPTPFAQGQWGLEQTVAVKFARRPNFDERDAQ